MNAERLLQHYEKIADAPDAIARLRRFILDLAVRGKLVPQDASGEPASELLKRIAKEKARLVKAGEIRKPPTLEPITDAEALYDLPRTWAWVRVGDIFDYDAGAKRDPKEMDQSLWLLELEDIEKDTSRIVERLRVSDRDSQSTKSEFEPGDILYGKLRPYLNKVVVANEPGYSTTEIVAIRPFLRMCPEYCALAFRRPDFVAYVERLGRGTKMPRLRTPDAIVAPFPLPPLAEQHRIVAKVDELMGLCDRLEAARAGREALRDRLAAASLARLNAPDPETFQADARFALDALPALTTRPDQIRRLRQTILNLAVRGKLVPQDANDEPAPELLKRIAKEIAAYGKANRIGQMQGDPIPEDLPFAAPAGWVWTRLSSLFKVITDGDHQPPPKGDQGVAFLTIGNITTGRIEFNGCRLVPESYFKSLAPYRTPARGDILYTVVGATFGRPALVDTDRAFCVQRHIAILKPVEQMSLRFLSVLLASPLIYDQAARSTTGTAQPTIALRPLRNFLAPLPPLAEQHRIVRKVDALMALCDRLEASLTATAATRHRLLDALLAEALAPVDKREMEAAE
ncbi:restriction endonuclease subunit S [Xanthobacter flavus]|uniref:restriction endonuclease subunit S n=1 Tax=Xanthobacter flavus TaxID=281 RepID=UPI003726E2B3